MLKKYILTAALLGATPACISTSAFAQDGAASPAQTKKDDAFTIVEAEIKQSKGPLEELTIVRPNTTKDFDKFKAESTTGGDLQMLKATPAIKLDLSDFLNSRTPYALTQDELDWKSSDPIPSGHGIDDPNSYVVFEIADDDDAADPKGAHRRHRSGRGWTLSKPARLVPESYVDLKGEGKEASQSLLDPTQVTTVPVLAVERDKSGVVYLFYDTKGVTPGTKLYTGYRRNKDGKEVLIVPAKEAAVIEAPRIGAQSHWGSVSVGTAKVKLLPQSGRMTPVQALRSPGGPPLTPPSGTPLPFGAFIAANSEEKQVYQLKLGESTVEGLPALSGRGWRTDLKAKALISESNRDPNSLISAGVSVWRSLNQATHEMSSRYTVLHRDEGLLLAPVGFSFQAPQSTFAPRHSTTYTAPINSVTAGSSDSTKTSAQSLSDVSSYRLDADLLQLQLTSDLRYLAAGKIGDFLKGTPQSDADSPSKAWPGVLTLNVIPLAYSNDHLSRQVFKVKSLTDTIDPGVVDLTQDGWRGPISKLNAQWETPISSGGSLSLSANLIHFWEDRNSVARKYFTSRGIIVPYDLPRFPDHVYYLEAAFTLPKILPGDLPNLRVGYRTGFTQSQSYYDPFAQNTSTWFFEAAK